MQVKVQPGFVVTVVREGVTNKYLGGTACELSEDEARENVAILTNTDDSPLNLPTPVPAVEVASETTTRRTRNTSTDN